MTVKTSTLSPKELAKAAIRGRLLAEKVALTTQAAMEATDQRDDFARILRGTGMSLRDVGAMVGLSHTQVSNIEG